MLGDEVCYYQAASLCWNILKALSINEKSLDNVTVVIGPPHTHPHTLTHTHTWHKICILKPSRKFKNAHIYCMGMHRVHTQCQYIYVVFYMRMANYTQAQMQQSMWHTETVQAHVILLSSFCRDNRWSCQLTHNSEENTVQTQHTVKYPGVHTHTLWHGHTHSEYIPLTHAVAVKHSHCRRSPIPHFFVVPRWKWLWPDCQS